MVSCRKSRLQGRRGFPERALRCPEETPQRSEEAPKKGIGSEREGTPAAPLGGTELVLGLQDLLDSDQHVLQV
jgi:hypothetical protein